MGNWLLYVDYKFMGNQLGQGHLPSWLDFVETDFSAVMINLSSLKTSVSYLISTSKFVIGKNPKHSKRWRHIISQHFFSFFTSIIPTKSKYYLEILVTMIIRFPKLAWNKVRSIHVRVWVCYASHLQGL